MVCVCEVVKHPLARAAPVARRGCGTEVTDTAHRFTTEKQYYKKGKNKSLPTRPHTISNRRSKGPRDPEPIHINQRFTGHRNATIEDLR